MGRRCSGPQLQRWAPSHAGCDRTYCRCDGQKAVGTAKRGQTQECRRTQYLPGLAEYMASYAKKFVQYGVRIVGGCCGTTPEHIKAIREAVTGVRKNTGIKPAATGVHVAAGFTPVPVALDERSKLGRKLAHNDFVKIVEMIPPMGHD